MANGLDLQTVGRALSGLSAGIQGRGLEFAQGMQQEEQRRQQQEEQLSEERRRAQFIDARVGLDLLKSGQVDAFNNLAMERVGAIKQLGGSPDETLTPITMVRQGNIEGAIQYLQNADNEGVTRGFLDKRDPAGPETVKGGDISSQGQIVQKDAAGNFVASDVQGFKTDKKAQGKQIANDLRRLDSRAEVSTRMRSEINGQIKPFIDRQQFSSTINNVLDGDGGISDIALGVAFYKIVDPGSVVSQGEFGQLADSRGLSDKTVGIFDKISKGDRLNDAERKTIANLANNQLKTFRNQAEKDVKRLLNVANADQRFKSAFSPNEVFGSSISGLLSGGDIDPEKLGLPVAPAPPSAPELGSLSDDDLAAQIEAARRAR